MPWFDEDGFLDTRLNHADQAHLTLWAHVLKLGLQDTAAAMKAMSKDGKRIKYSTEPYDRRVVLWFHSNEISPGSFCWICDLLGFNVEYVRNRVYANRRTLSEAIV